MTATMEGTPVIAETTSVYRVQRYYAAMGEWITNTSYTWPGTPIGRAAALGHIAGTAPCHRDRLVQVHTTVEVVDHEPVTP